MMTDAEQQAASCTQEVLTSAQQECEGMKQAAREKLEQAVDFLMEKVVSI